MHKRVFRKLPKLAVEEQNSPLRAVAQADAPVCKLYRDRAAAGEIGCGQQRAVEQTDPPQTQRAAVVIVDGIQQKRILKQAHLRALHVLDCVVRKVP